VTSIRTFLVLAVLATLILFNFIAAIQGYRSSMAEAERLFDDQMLETAKLIANLPIGIEPQNSSHSSAIAFQLWRNNEKMLASANAPAIAIAELKPGFDFINFDGYRWRTLAYFDRSHDVWVTLAERSDTRYLLAENVILESIFPLLIGIPIVGLLIWLIINQGLRPLIQLSAELREKKADDLTPVSNLDSRQELTQVTRSVNSLIERLRLTLEREKRFTADAAHELRTPISALKIQLHNIAQEVPAGSEALAQLGTGVDRMQHLVEQLLFLYRATPEQFSQNIQLLDIYVLAEELLAEQYYLFEAKQQTVELLGEHCLVEGNDFALNTLLKNLLSNANKYTPKGGQISISVQATPQGVRLTVEDSGPGVPKELEERIFERFYRVGQASDEDISGCGLGLTIVKNIVELQGAKIRVERSSFDSGSAFIIDFDAAKTDVHS